MLRCRKAHSFQIIKDIEPKDHNLKTWMNSNFYTFREISRQRALRSGMFGLGWFIDKNDSASPKIVIKMYFNFFLLFLKVSELVECRRDYPYMTANKNFSRFCSLVIIRKLCHKFNDPRNSRSKVQINIFWILLIWANLYYNYHLISVRLKNWFRKYFLSNRRRNFRAKTKTKIDQLSFVNSTHREIFSEYC